MATTKISGAQFKQFYFCEDAQVWPEDAYVEDMTLSINGADAQEVEDVSTIEDTALVKVSSGWIVSLDNVKPVSLAKALERWLSRQSTATLVVTVPKGHEDAITDFVKSLGGSVL